MTRQPAAKRQPRVGNGSLGARCIALAMAVATTCAFGMNAKMTLIEGRITGEHIPEEIPLNVVRNGEAVLHSKVQVAKDGTFGFYFQPEYTGFYTVGERGGAARLFLAPGKAVQLTMDGETFTVGAGDRENTLLANWAKTLWELKKCNQLRGNHTYKEVFPTLPALEIAKDATLAGVQGNGSAFDRLFPKLVEAEFEYELYHFLNMPRTVHPKPEEYPEIYRIISTAPRFADATVLNFDFGLSFAYFYCMFQYSAHRDDFKAGADVMGDVCLKFVRDETVKGWFIAKNVLTRAKAYDAAYTAKLEKFRKYLVTDEQRKLVSDFILTINKTAAGEPAAPFEGTTPDGKTVRLSDFKGKVVVVDVWATWCGPCRAQIPPLRKLEEEMKGRDVVFVSYSVDAAKDLDKWKSMVVDGKMGGVQLIGDAAFKSPICVDYKITAIPRFLVFDKKGNILSIDAPRPSSPDLKALLEKCLK